MADAIDRPLVANMVKGGKTPLLSAAELEALGYRIAAYPLSLLSSAVRAMQDALATLGRGETPKDVLPFAELREIVGFDAYDRELARYAQKREGEGT